MSKITGITLAAKSAPEEKIFMDMKKAGLEAVELYLTQDILGELPEIVQLCKCFPFKYAVHAPNDGYQPEKLLELTERISAEVLVFHNIYWEDEWRDIARLFQNAETKVCIENVTTVHEPLKFIRRYGFGRCMDLEHMQMECAGVYEEEFIQHFRKARHIHMTGYTYGSQLWHTHIHHSPEHNLYLLNLLDRAGYRGFVLSEARASLQNYEEFKKLSDFFKQWKSKK